MNGRDLLFSAERDTLPARLEEVDGAKAEADPASKAAARAAIFTIFNVLVNVKPKAPALNSGGLRHRERSQGDRVQPGTRIFPRDLKIQGG